jgi:H+/Cl- antiporter ClcA
MSEAKNEHGELHELAGGWISERKGTRVPTFLKLAYVGFSIFGLVYLFQYVMGEVDHATRGPLVQQLNAATDKPPSAWIAALAVILVAFVAGLLWYALVRKGEADE